MDPKFSKSLLRLANRIRDAEILTDEHVTEADGILWRVYEAGELPADELVKFAVRVQLAIGGSEGTLDTLLSRWFQCCGTWPTTYTDWPPEDTEFKQLAEHGIRQFVQLCSASKSDDAPQWSTAQSPTEWGLMFKCSPDAFLRRVKAKTIRAKMYTRKSYAVDLRDMPARNRR